MIRRAAGLIWAIVCLLGAGCASVQMDDYTVYKRSPKVPNLVTQPLSVIFTNAEGIEFRGIASQDDSVDSANVLYSGAGGVGGIAAQIAVHAVMVNEAQERKLQRQREQADLALAPLSPQIDALQELDLSTLSLEGHFSVKPSHGDGDIPSVYVDSHPIFFVTEDLGSLSIKNVLSLRRSHAPEGQPVYRNLIEVVYDQSAEADPEEALAEKGLETLVRKLYQESLLIALEDMEGRLEAQGQQPETFRYTLDGNLRLERGVLVEESCSEVVLRNLRGWLIRFPKPEAHKGCPGMLADSSIESSAP